MCAETDLDLFAMAAAILTDFQGLLLCDSAEYSLREAESGGLDGSDRMVQMVNEFTHYHFFVVCPRWWWGYALATSLKKVMWRRQLEEYLMDLKC
jgi:hypothetical protein